MEVYDIANIGSSKYKNKLNTNVRERLLKSCSQLVELRNCTFILFVLCKKIQKKNSADDSKWRISYDLVLKKMGNKLFKQRYLCSLLF